MISILDRYLVRAIVTGVVLVLLVLLSLSAFINLVAEFDNIGTGDFQMVDAFTYVLLRIPKQAFDMLPVAALIGALFGLGNLAANSELIVMRGAGLSVMRIARSVLLAGLLLAILGAALGELIAPPAEQFARSERARLLNRQVSIAGNASTWVKDDRQIVNVRQLSDENRAGGVYLFTFDDAHQLLSIGLAASARIDERQRWLLQDFRQTRFTDEGVVTSREALSMRGSRLNPEVLNLSVVDPERLAGASLLRYIGYLQDGGLETRSYEIAFWARVATVGSVLFMTLLALPFVFGPLRSSGTGQRLLIGVVVGIGYFLASKTLLNSGEVFNLNPFLTAWLPALVMILATSVALARVR